MLTEKDRNEFKECLAEMTRNLLLSIEMKTETAYTSEKVLEPDEFAFPVQLKKFAGISKQLKLHVRPNEIIEEDIKDTRVVYRYLLSSIRYIKVKHRKDYHKVVLCSSHGLHYKLKLSPHEADYLLSSVLHAIQGREEAESRFPSVFIEPANLALKVHGHSVDMDSLFEIPLKKELEEAMREKDVHSGKLRELVFDAALNMTFRGIEFDAKFVFALFELLAKYAEALTKAESDPNSYELYLAHKPKIDGDTVGKEVFEIYQGIPPLLSILRKCLPWRSSLPDNVTFKSQTEILLALASSRNSAVSIMASLALKSVLKVCAG